MAQTVQQHVSFHHEVDLIHDTRKTVFAYKPV